MGPTRVEKGWPYLSLLRSTWTIERLAPLWFQGPAGQRLASIQPISPLFRLLNLDQKTHEINILEWSGMEIEYPREFPDSYSNWRHSKGGRKWDEMRRAKYRKRSEMGDWRGEGRDGVSLEGGGGDEIVSPWLVPFRPYCVYSQLSIPSSRTILQSMGRFQESCPLRQRIRGREGRNHDWKERERERGDMRATNLERERGPVRFPPLWHRRGRGGNQWEGEGGLIISAVRKDYR